MALHLNLVNGTGSVESLFKGGGHVRDFLEYIETRIDELDKEDVAKAKALWQSVA